MTLEEEKAYLERKLKKVQDSIEIENVKSDIKILDEFVDQLNIMHQAPVIDKYFNELSGKLYNLMSKLDSKAIELRDDLNNL